MENFFTIVIVILIIVANVSKKKKKQAQQQKTQKQQKQDQPHRYAFEMQKYQSQKPVQSFAPKAAPAPKAVSAFAQTSFGQEGFDPCHEDQLSGAMPHAGEEGYDPCHEEMFPASEAQKSESIPREANEAAKELLRGVIFSEILSRPQKQYVRR